VNDQPQDFLPLLFMLHAFLAGNQGILDVNDYYSNGTIVTNIFTLTGLNFLFFSPSTVFLIKTEIVVDPTRLASS
jgi:hypothetical protein